MDLSVIIVNRDGGNRLRCCLDSVNSQGLAGGWEVLVVDNGSTDGSREMVRSCYPSVRLIEVGRNLGFAAGNNLGIRHARGRHVILLNNDAYARAGFLAALLASVEADPRIGAVTSKLVFAADPGRIQNAGCMLLSDGSGADRGAGEADHGQYATREEVFAFCGAAALLRREALDQVGVFDERFFMYYEDTDLSWRLRLRGWRVLYEPAAVAEHDHAGTAGEWTPFFTFHVDRNRVFMLLKNARWGFAIRCLFSLGSRVTRIGDRAASRPGRRSVQVRVLGSLLWNLAGVLWERRHVRAGRTVPDSSIERWLYPRDLWDARCV